METLVKVPAMRFARQWACKQPCWMQQVQPCSEIQLWHNAGIKGLAKNQMRTRVAYESLGLSSEIPPCSRAFFTYMKSLIHLTVDLFPEVLTNEPHKHRKRKKRKKKSRRKLAIRMKIKNELSRLQEVPRLLTIVIFLSKCIKTISNFKEQKQWSQK